MREQNSSVSKNSKVVIAVVAVSIIVVAIVVAAVFFLTTNKNKPKNSVSAPSKTCIQMREKAVNAQKNLIKSLSDDDVIRAINIKKS